MAGDPWRKEEGKVPAGRRPMAGAGGPLRLRDWLVAQIESGRYAGLRWEDAGKTLFRIPWKHAAQQGYRAQQDAALFRAWAIYKGKHLEGIDKEDPPTWKTRLRCALNKSADFCEVRERSQLDVSNPYKVYRIVSNGAHCPVARACAPSEKKNILQSQQESPREVTEPACRTDQDSSRSTTEDKDEEQPPRLAQRASLPSAAQLTGPLADHRYQVQEPAYHWSPLPSSEDFSNPGKESPVPIVQMASDPMLLTLELNYQFIYTGSCSYLLLVLVLLLLLLELSLSFIRRKHQKLPTWGPAGPRAVGASPALLRGCSVLGPPTPGAPPLPPLSRPADCWLHVRLFYRAELVQETTARTAEGCRLSPRAVTAAERLLGPPPRIAQVRFPEPPPGAHVLRHLLRHLERGVLLWVAPEGVFAKRLCRGRVYWRGPLAPHRAQPNKLERERTCQLLDTRRFLEELRAHLQDGGQEPEYQIHLCFGEEYPGPPDQPEERLIMAHVEPVFARQLFLDSKRHYRGAPALASPQLSMSDGVTHLLTAQLNQQ
uniref:interferon regulatory factor 4-like n=1 Tax=Nyctereutes procyonoides TaxID=34880 RepID=UPI00244448BF|nr:interferon regulatory factor 4-like [Nyctereutes procyonoides]